tara:strand:- start:1755 stop:2453 length:699 start_codon:yes stop_codon:yes gene_type:complete
MSKLNYGDYSWAVKLPPTKEGCKEIILRFLKVGANVVGGYDTKWKYLMAGVDSISPCICDNHRLVVSIDEAIKRFTTEAVPMTETTKSTSPKADKLVEVYVKMRNKKAELTRANKDEIGLIDEQMAKIATALDKIMYDTGTDSLKTANGTAFKATKDFVGVLEIEDFREFLAKETAGDDKVMYEKIVNNFPWHFYTKSVSKPAVVQYIKDHDGLAPDGLKYTKLLETQVRTK